MVMKTIRLHSTGDLRQHEEPMPKPGHGEILVRVTAVGICGSDLHWFGEAGIGDAKLNQPLILGHEFAGVIAEGPRQGERVAVDPAIPCKVCEFCRQGNPNLCINLRFAGHGMEDGALREYLSWPDGCLFPLPDSLSARGWCHARTAWRGAPRRRLGQDQGWDERRRFWRRSDRLADYATGASLGAQAVYVTDILPHRLDTAHALGATKAIFAGNGSEITEIMAITGGRGVDVAFEFAGENEAVEAAVAAVKPGGRVVLAGIPADDRTSFSASVARRKGLTIKLVRRMKFTYPRAIQLVESGQVDVRSLVTHHFPLEQRSGSLHGRPAPGRIESHH